MDSAIGELLGLLKTGNPTVRNQAVATVLSLTGTEDGRKLLLQSEIPAVLCRLVGDVSGSAENAVKSLINLSADGELMQSMLKEGMISKLMESLRDTDCTWKRYVVMLLSNLSQTDEGCIQLMQLHDPSSPLKGLHLRRLVQYFVGSVAVPPGSRYSPTNDTEATWDAFEYCGDIISNVTRLEEARKILLEPERRILPVIFPQLLSQSVVRRRGAACTLRNCCFERADPTVRYMLSPSVDVITALLQPLVGPDSGQYAPEDREFMNPALFKNSGTRKYESDPFVRRQLLESFLLLAGTRLARDHMRRVRVYPIIKSFHEWLEGTDEPAKPADAAAGAAADSSSDNGGALVGPRDDDDVSEALHPEDEAGVEAINKLVQQLFREDEYVWPSAAGAAAGASAASQRAARPNAAPAEDAATGLVPAGAAGQPARKPVDETTMETLAGKMDKASIQAAAERRSQRFATVPAEKARATAAAVSRGVQHVDAVPEDELETLTTKVPDWTEDDPELPEAFRPKPAAEGSGAGAAGQGGS